MGWVKGEFAIGAQFGRQGDMWRGPILEQKRDAAIIELIHLELIVVEFGPKTGVEKGLDRDKVHISVGWWYFSGGILVVVLVVVVGVLLGGGWNCCCVCEGEGGGG